MYTNKEDDTNRKRAAKSERVVGIQLPLFGRRLAPPVFYDCCDWLEDPSAAGVAEAALSATVARMNRRNAGILRFNIVSKNVMFKG